MKDISRALRQILVVLDGITRESVTAYGRKPPWGCTVAERMMFEATGPVQDAADWLELNRTPAHAEAFRQRFDRLERLAGQATFRRRTKRDKVATADFLLQKRRTRGYLCDMLATVGGDGTGNGKRRRRGRPRGTGHTDPRADRRLAEAWQTGQYRRHADLAREKGMKPNDVKAALDRHRKRRK